MFFFRKGSFKKKKFIKYLKSVYRSKKFCFFFFWGGGGDLLEIQLGHTCAL